MMSRKFLLVLKCRKSSRDNLFFSHEHIIFCSCVFFLSHFFPRLFSAVTGRRLDVYHTSTHDVALVRI